MPMLKRKCRTSRLKLPACATNHATSLVAYGARCLERASGLVAANCCQCSTAEPPTNGIFSSQPGGGGILTVDNDLNQPTISSDWSRMVRTAKQIGTIKTSSSSTVITNTASQRLPQSRLCSLRKNGQVAMTIMVAHSNDERN